MSFVKTNTVLLSASGVDTYTVSIPFAEALSYISNQLLVIGFTVNTGASTLNINSLGALPIYKNVSTALAAGDLSGYNILYFSGSSFQIIGKVTSAGSGSGDLLAANNLSDVANAATARTNLGLDTTANQSDSSNKRFMTDAQETNLDAQSGTNTGDNATNTQYSGLAASKLNTTAFDGLAKITVGTTTPVAPTTGDLWVDLN